MNTRRLSTSDENCRKPDEASLSVQLDSSTCDVEQGLAPEAAKLSTLSNASDLIPTLGTAKTGTP